MNPSFRTTRWSLVLAARESAAPGSHEALAELCEAYWYPVYAFVRRQGHDAEAARDLTQGYFALLLEKHYLRDVRHGASRFRAFLKASVRHFLANRWDHDRAVKRGGGATHISLDAEEAERRLQLEAGPDADPELAFERRFAMALLERALEQLREEFARAGKAAQFERFQPHLTGDGEGSPYRTIGAELGMTEGAVRVALHRARRHFGEILRAEVAQVVADPEEVDDELRHLIEVLGPARS